MHVAFLPPSSLACSQYFPSHPLLSYSPFPFHVPTFPSTSPLILPYPLQSFSSLLTPPIPPHLPLQSLPLPTYPSPSLHIPPPPYIPLQSLPLPTYPSNPSPSPFFPPIPPPPLPPPPASSSSMLGELYLMTEGGTELRTSLLKQRLFSPDTSLHPSWLRTLPLMLSLALRQLYPFHLGVLYLEFVSITSSTD